MVQFNAFEKGIRVSGQAILSVVEGIKDKKWEGYKILDDNNISDPQPGEWYAQQDWLNSFKVIAKKIKKDALYQIGKMIPETAIWPSHVKDIHSALASIDVAYHMNHEKAGKVMFDAKTGKIEDGIGHYTYKKIGPKKAMMICNNPYPCNFDLGIIEAVAYKFKKEKDTIKVVHDYSRPCRNKGKDSCTYIVTW